MTPLPFTAELQALARRVIWFEEPEQALKSRDRFIAYAMTYASFDDMTTLRQHVTDDELREALRNAPPGIIDARSWAYWHLKLGQYPAPEMPTRQL